MKFETATKNRLYNHGLGGNVTGESIIPDAKFGHTHYIQVVGDFTLEKPIGIPNNEFVHIRIIIYSVGDDKVSFAEEYSAKGLREYGLSSHGFNIVNYVSVNGEVVCWLDHDNTSNYNNLLDILENPNQATPDMFFGSAIALTGDGKKMFISIEGSVGGIGSSGIGVIYEYINGQDNIWYRENTIINFSANGLYGSSIACNYDGTRLVVASQTTTDGVVTTYNLSNSQWVAVGTETIMSTLNLPSVSMSGDGKILVIGQQTIERIVICEYDENSATNWTVLNTYDTSAEESEVYGFSVWVNYDGSKIIVTDPEHLFNSSSAVYVYNVSYNPLTITELGGSPNQPTFTTTNGYGNDITAFGGSGGIDNIYIGSNLSQGIILCYKKVSNSYIYVGDIRLNDSSDQSGFGNSLAVDASGEILMAGRPQHSPNVNNSGSISEFRKIK